MNQETRQQYSAIQTSIRGNINAIRVLLMQVDTMNETVATITDVATKAALDQSISNVYKSINLLIDETENLFNSLQAVRESAVID